MPTQNLANIAKQAKLDYIRERSESDASVNTDQLTELGALKAERNTKYEMRNNIRQNNDLSNELGGERTEGNLKTAGGSALMAGAGAALLLGLATGPIGLLIFGAIAAVAAVKGVGLIRSGWEKSNIAAEDMKDIKDENKLIRNAIKNYGKDPRRNDEKERDKVSEKSEQIGNQAILDAVRDDPEVLRNAANRETFLSNAANFQSQDLDDNVLAAVQSAGLMDQFENKAGNIHRERLDAFANKQNEEQKEDPEIVVPPQEQSRLEELFENFRLDMENRMKSQASQMEEQMTLLNAKLNLLQPENQKPGKQQPAASTIPKTIPSGTQKRAMNGDSPNFGDGGLDLMSFEGSDNSVSTPFGSTSERNVNHFIDAFVESDSPSPLSNQMHQQTQLADSYNRQASTTSGEAPSNGPSAVSVGTVSPAEADRDEMRSRIDGRTLNPDNSPPRYMSANDGALNGNGRDSSDRTQGATTGFFSRLRGGRRKSQNGDEVFNEPINNGRGIS